MSIFSVLGKKGTIEVLHKIKDGVNSFTSIKNALDMEGCGVSTRTLAERLNDLEEENLIQKDGGKYYLTKKGEEAIEIIENIIEWENKWKKAKIPKIIIGMLGDKER
ncbi:winged helix-turn-helix transcriptional regulator [Methanocaldococcus fervens]|uniref:Transcriptional regulator, HxlR family n=1 Tax=Methanocaldococcus fervens (strain DSM 4213 / JCM 15782 / AG86) TaxID=573064 RepID=C7P5T5_METFA|nr:winged helix-turn-helix transcriptional regulator [Methanocaldococcus fervens]ACV23917.1 transcriptional regulator, HxlR family [Methanocaldococcus fervens AG86]